MQTRRFEAVDVLRGVAVAWMTAFHFAFDLAYLGFTRQDFYRDPVWTWQRTAIVSLFLFCAGLSQAIAIAQAQSTPRFRRRWLQIAGCALLVTIGSYLVFPRSFIYFGVLHGIAAMLIVVRLTAHWGQWLWLAGALAIAAKFAAAWGHANGMLPPALDAPVPNWLGLIGRKPVTEDYVPLVPWLGVMWWGMAAGQGLLRRRPQALAVRMPRATAPLAWLGRWSLAWYMLHQPVLLGALMAIAALK